MNLSKYRYLEFYFYLFFVFYRLRIEKEKRKDEIHRTFLTRRENLHTGEDVIGAF